jgi:hypothetical protein
MQLPCRSFDSLDVSFQFLVYVTWIVWIFPHVDFWLSAVFLLFSGVLWYYFLYVSQGDPGVLSSTREETYEVCIQFVPLQCNLLLNIWLDLILITAENYSIKYKIKNTIFFLFRAYIVFTHV